MLNVGHEILTIWADKAVLRKSQTYIPLSWNKLGPEINIIDYSQHEIFYLIWSQLQDLIYQIKLTP